MLKAARELISFAKPSARNFQNVKTYIDYEDPLDEVERYIYRKEDLITLSTRRDKAWLNWFFDNFVFNRWNTDLKWPFILRVSSLT